MLIGLQSWNDEYRSQHPLRRMGPGLRRDDRCECRASFGSRALRGLHHHDIAVGAVVLRRRMALEVIAAECDLVADEFVAELEGVEPVATDAAVPQADH